MLDFEEYEMDEEAEALNDEVCENINDMEESPDVIVAEGWGEYVVTWGVRFSKV